MIRGADLVARTLERAGLTEVFTLSGNHIMPIFDAVIGTKVRLTHVRHEAAAVHIADAWARLSGGVGIALVTGGPGHTNAVAALATAQAAESPVVLLSGNAGLDEVGRGAFQEMNQAAIAAPLCKASWTAASAEQLGHDIARAVSIARSGRPGPVHVSLPADLLDVRMAENDGMWPKQTDFAPEEQPLSDENAAAIAELLHDAARPLILAGPAMSSASDRSLLRKVSAALAVPAIVMESPRGINDPQLGDFGEILRAADLIVLLGKAHDFTLRFADPPFVDPGCRLIVVDPEATMLGRVRHEKGVRLVFGAIADSRAAAATLSLTAGARRGEARDAWLREVADALTFRPPDWSGQQTKAGGRVHPVDFCRGVASVLSDSKSIFVSDGGEIGQWAQSLIDTPRRLINGVGGSIGSSIPFALASRLLEPNAPVIAVMGDGTFGFHMAEFDTAVRYNLPFVAVVGNDATWNAEYQIQVRSYGEARAQGCTLLPSRYDKVAEALGGHGEFVERSEELLPALQRALASGRPACVNVMIERVAAPIIRRA